MEENIKMSVKKEKDAGLMRRGLSFSLKEENFNDRVSVENYSKPSEILRNRQNLRQNYYEINALARPSIYDKKNEGKAY